MSCKQPNGPTGGAPHPIWISAARPIAKGILHLRVFVINSPTPLSVTDASANRNRKLMNGTSRICPFPFCTSSSYGSVLILLPIPKLFLNTAITAVSSSNLSVTSTPPRNPSAPDRRMLRHQVLANSSNRHCPPKERFERGPCKSGQTLPLPHCTLSEVFPPVLWKPSHRLPPTIGFIPGPASCNIASDIALVFPAQPVLLAKWPS